MDYLLSLVGKDQDTIVDAIKVLAANAEKVKDQQKEIVDIQKELDESKEEIHYLNNKLNQKYDIIEDMENDLDKIEEKYKDAQKEIEFKDKELNELEKFISKQVEENNILQDNNQSMVSQIAENIRMEKKIKVQEGVIKELGEKLKIETKEEFEEVIGERDILIFEVENLKRENAEKIELLENIEQEKEMLKEKLQNVETENIDLKDDAKRAKEVSLVEQIMQFECDYCENKFLNKSDLRMHMRKIHEQELWKSKLVKIENEVAGLKYRLSSDIYRLAKFEQLKKETCNCKGFCVINHTWYTWTKSSSDSILFQMNILAEETIDETDDALSKCYQCETCETKFLSPVDFIHHIENFHKVADVKFLEN